MGDLIQQYQEGRSSLWYWWQVLVAITVSFVRGIWQQKFRAVLAIAAGGIIVFIHNYFFLHPTLRLIEEFNPNNAAYYLFSRILQRSWWVYYKWLYPALFAFISAMMGAIVGAFSGWVVSKFYRSRTSIVLLYAATMSFYWFWPMIQAISQFGILVLLGTSPVFFIYSFFLGIMTNAVVVLSILFGGGLLSNQRSGDGSRSTVST